ncbi:MAG: hypothetical protein M5R36_16665 [Deltaproteobacteria bacterium]|nr:hypothetical protein [Deltaproteobacteria bacterium]
MRHNVGLWCLAATLLFVAGAFACGDDDDDNDDDALDDDTEEEDAVDDDCWEMPDDPDFPEGRHDKCGDWDDWEDDDEWDDDLDGEPPVLSNGRWEPAAVIWSADCETADCLALRISFCDPDGDLTDPGGVWIYVSGGVHEFFGDPNPFSWSIFNPDGADVTDCDAPVDGGLGLLLSEDAFGDGPGDYELAVDVEATDASGNVSNKLTNITATITYNGA